MKKNLLTLLFGLVVINCLAVIPKAEVISDGDRGLALEATYNICLLQICNIDSSDIIVYGVCESEKLEIGDTIVYAESSNKFRYLARISNNGHVKWLKKITTDGSLTCEKIFTTDSSIVYVRLYCCAGDKVVDNSYKYEDIILSPDDHSYHKYDKDILLKINTENGNLYDFVEMNNVWEARLLRTTDGGFVYMGCISATPEYTYIQPFVGLNNDRLRSDTTTNNIMDLYFAKINPDFTLGWDFALRSDNNNYDAQRYEVNYNYIQGALSGDTLYIFGMMMSDSVDMDPDIKKEWYVKGTQYYTNVDSVTCFLASYDISGDYPKLLKAKNKPFHRWTYNEFMYSTKERGVFLALNNPHRQLDVDDDVYIYVSLDSSLTLNYDTITTSGAYNVVTADVFHYDSANNFILPNNRPWLFKDPLTFNFSSVTEPKEFLASDYAIGAISKFSPTGDYRWSFVGPGLEIKSYELSPNDGAVYLAGNSYTLGDGWDINPDENKSTILSTDAGYFFAKYHETYKLTAQADLQHGQMAVPDTFGWHGYDYTVSVVADSGYHVERVYTNTGKELEPKGDGLYLLKNLTDPVVIYADVSEGAGIAEVHYEKMEIAPNPVSDYITLSAQFDDCSYAIYAIDGRLVQTGVITQPVSVQGLVKGVYELRIRSASIVFEGRFIKE